MSCDMINKFLELKPEDRLSFKEIIELIRKNEFKLIDGVEKNISQIKASLLI